jgi:serine/threonine-protein kinase RsbT
MAVAMMAGRNAQEAVLGFVPFRMRAPFADREIATDPTRNPDVRVPIAGDGDVIAARQTGRVLSLRMGFSSAEATIVATAISELARNIVLYASRGEIAIRPERRGARVGLTVIARDEGPGIPDVGRAMQDGYSSGGRLGVGLPGVRRLMDDFQIASSAGDGTTVTATKWGEAA